MSERLYRSRYKKMIGGVAAGLGKYINVDPVLIRVLFVIFTIINPLTLLAYIILWIVVEEEPYRSQAYEMGSSEFSTPENADQKENVDSEEESAETYKTEEKKVKADGRGRTIAGIILIAIGFVFLADEWFPRFDFVDIFPYALVAGGIWLLINSKKKERN